MRSQNAAIFNIALETTNHLRVGRGSNTSGQMKAVFRMDMVDTNGGYQWLDTNGCIVDRWGV